MSVLAALRVSGSQRFFLNACGPRTACGWKCWLELADVCGCVCVPHDSVSTLNDGGSFSKQQVRYVVKRSAAMNARIREEFTTYISKRHVSKERKDSIVNVVCGPIERMDVRTISIMLSQCKAGRYINYDLFTSIARAVLNDREMLDKFLCKDVSMVIRALAILSQGVHYEPDPPPNFFAGCTQLVYGLINNARRLEKSQKDRHPLKSRQALHVIHGCGILAQKGVVKAGSLVEFFDKVMIRLCYEERLHSRSPRDLCEALEGFYLLGYRNINVLRAVCREIEFRAFCLSKDAEEYVSRINVKKLRAVDPVLIWRFPLQTRDIFRVDDMARVVYWLAKLGYNSVRTLNGVSKLMQGRVRELRPDSLCRLVHGLGVLGYRSEALLEEACDEIVRRVRLKKCQNDDFVELVCGLGLLGVGDVQALISVCEEATEPERLESFSNEHLCRIVEAIRDLEYRHGVTLDVLAGEMVKVERLVAYSSEDLASALVSFVDLGYCPEAKSEFCNEATKPWRMELYSCGDLVHIAHAYNALRFRDNKAVSVLKSEVRKLTRLRTFTGLELCNMVCELVELGVKDMGLFSKCGRELCRAERKNEFTCNQVLDVLDSFATVGFFDSDTHSQLLSHVEAAGYDSRLTRLVELLHGWGMHEARLKPNFVAKAVSRLMRMVMWQIERDERLDALSGSDIAKACCAGGRFHYYDPKLAHRMVDKFLALREMGFASDESLPSLFYGCARLNINHPTLTQSVIDTMDKVAWGQDSIHVLWGLCLFDACTPQRFNTLAANLLKTLPKLDSGSSRELLQSWVCLEPGVKEDADPRLADLLARAKESFDANWDEMHPDVENSIRLALEGLEISCVHRNVEIEGGLHVAKFIAGIDELVAIECNGPAVSPINDTKSSALMGQGHMRNKVIENSGYKVLPIWLKDWEPLSDVKREEVLGKELRKHGIRKYM